MRSAMNDDQIKDIIRDYIIGGHESDNADCLHERDELENPEDLQRAYALYRTAVVRVSWE